MADAITTAGVGSRKGLQDLGVGGVDDLYPVETCAASECGDLLPPPEQHRLRDPLAGQASGAAYDGLIPSLR